MGIIPQIRQAMKRITEQLIPLIARPVSKLICAVWLTTLNTRVKTTLHSSQHIRGCGEDRDAGWCPAIWDGCLNAWAEHTKTWRMFGWEYIWRGNRWNWRYHERQRRHPNGNDRTWPLRRLARSPPGRERSRGRGRRSSGGCFWSVSNMRLFCRCINKLGIHRIAPGLLTIILRDWTVKVHVFISKAHLVN